MNGHAALVAIAIAFLAFIKSGDAIQCWDCSSDSFGLCRDPFNASDFHRVSFLQQTATNSPRLISCSPPNYNQGGNINYGGGNYGGNNYGGNTVYGQQRQVCFKRVEVDKRYHRTLYHRGCHTLNDAENVGSCPTSTTYSDLSVDFCEYCDTHQCNGAQGLEKNAVWLGLISVAIALALRK